MTLIATGRLITKYGHYRIFPIIGTFVTGIGMWLFSHLSLQTTQLELSAWMVVLGLGIGMFMQVMTLAVQNAVDYSEMGVATSSATFFRSIGSSLGGAIFGAILVNRLALHLTHFLPGSAATVAAITKSVQNGVSSTGINQMSAADSHAIFKSFVLSFHDMFLLAIPVIALAFITALFLKETPLRTSVKTPEVI